MSPSLSQWAANRAQTARSNLCNGKRRRSARQIADRQLRMRVQIYLLPADGTAQTRVFFDGRKIGKVGPGEHLTLLPSPGKHVIAVNDDRLTLELASTGQNYVRVSETGSWPRTKAHLKLVAPDQGQEDIADWSPYLRTSTDSSVDLKNRLSRLNREGRGLCVSECMMSTFHRIWMARV